MRLTSKSDLLATKKQRAYVYLYNAFSRQIRTLAKEIIDNLPVNNLIKQSKEKQTLTVSISQSKLLSQGIDEIKFDCGSENGWGTNAYERDQLIKKSVLFILGYLANYGKPQNQVIAKLKGKEMSAEIQINSKDSNVIQAKISIQLNPIKPSKPVLFNPPDIRPQKSLFD